MTSSLAAPRPTTVTIAIVLGWFSVLADIVAGLALVGLAGNDTLVSALNSDAATTSRIGYASLVFGVVLGLLVWLLSQGSSVVRLLLSIVLVLRIAVSVWAMIELGSHQLSTSVLTLALSVVLLGLLWNGKANAFFATNNP